MAVFGRSLAVARVASIVLAAAAATTPYLALRAAAIPRGRALLASAFALGTPWSLWLGAATVPESFTATLTAAGVFGLTAARFHEAPATEGDDDLGDGGASSGSLVGARTAILSATAIAAACLSRYEPWPVAAVLATVLAIRAARASSSGHSRKLLAGLTALCVLGPLLWMAWNAHAHDGPLHFFRRVSSFKRALGDGATDVTSALLLYPTLLFTTRPEIAIPTLFLVPAALRDPVLRRRWGIPLLAAAAQVAFLSYGNARDGAPAHHSERALLGTMVILALFTADAGMTKLHHLSLEGRTLAAKAGAAIFGIAWLISSVRGSDPPGRSASEDRSEQIARGEKLRADGVKAIAVTPCAYEHFALIAAYGAPENATIDRNAGAGLPLECPHVEPR